MTANPARRNNILVLSVTALALGAAGFIWVLSAPQGPKTEATAAATADIVSAGKVLYAENCAACHGANLEGQPNWKEPDADGLYPAPPHDETGHTWHHDDQLLFDYVKIGGAGVLKAKGVADFKSGMPAFGDTLSDADIRSILAYIASTWPERIQKLRKKRTATN